MYFIGGFYINFINLENVSKIILLVAIVLCGGLNRLVYVYIVGIFYRDESDFSYLVIVDKI